MSRYSSHTSTVFAWQHAHPDEITGRFWNMLLRDQPVYSVLEPLMVLFAVSVPVGQGKYNHHNGMQP